MENHQEARNLARGALWGAEGVIRDLGAELDKNDETDWEEVKKLLSYLVNDFGAAHNAI